MRLSPDAARILNLLGMLAMVGVLMGAYGYQFAHEELPCTLCLLQRLAMIAVALGAAMNVMLGPDPRHYGVILVSAALGGAVSVRQMMLHINPFFDTGVGQPTLEATSNPAFGEPVFGLHLYVWGLLLFAVVIFAVGAVMLFRGQFDKTASESAAIKRIGGIGVGLLVLIAGAQAVTTFMECGFGDCPNDGGWTWWLFG